MPPEPRSFRVLEAPGSPPLPGASFYRNPERHFPAILSDADSMLACSPLTALGLGRNRLEGSKSAPSLLLHAGRLRDIEPSRQPYQQFEKKLRKKIEQARGSVEPESRGTLGQNQERDDHCNPASKCHLEQSVERRFDWAFADLARNQEHDRAGEGSRAKARINGGGKSERRNGESKHAG